MKKVTLAAILIIAGISAYSQSVKVNTYTTNFQWSNYDVSADKLYHFQTQEYEYNNEVVSAINSGDNQVSTAYILAKPINYGFNVAFSPKSLNFNKGALYMVFGYSKLVQQEKFIYSSVPNGSEYETMEGKFFIDRSYVTTGLTWDETLLSKEKWGLVLGFEYLFHLNTNTNSHVTVRKDNQDGVEFVNSMERLDVPAVNIFSMGMNASPHYKLGKASSVSLELGVRILNYLNKTIYDKAQLSPNIALAYHYKF